MKVSNSFLVVYLKRNIPPEIKHIIKTIFNHKILFIKYGFSKKTRPALNIINRIKIIFTPRNTILSARFLSKKIIISDSFWFLPTYKEIWRNKIYQFETDRTKPFIIDCGANIGLSVIYWKYLYPEAIITAFEPDPNIYKLLENNILEFDLKNVTLLPFAVWVENGHMDFKPDGSVGGKLIRENKDNQSIPVKTVRLRDYLDKSIDMLKIDIEGSEREVLNDCQDALTNVENIFIEYHGIYTEAQVLQEILEILTKSGFRYHIKEANPVEHPFLKSELNQIFDLQLNIYGFRDY